MKIGKKEYDELKKLTIAQLNAAGEELLNPVPLELEVLPIEESLEAKIARLIQNQVSMQADAQGYETWEEFNDFEVKDPDDIPEFRSDFELMEDEEPKEFVREPMGVVDEGIRDAEAEDVSDSSPSNDDLESTDESPPKDDGKDSRSRHRV